MSRHLIEFLERRALLAASPTSVVGQGTFGGANFVPLHNFFINSITQNNVSVEGSVINIAPNATSVAVHMTGFVRLSGQSDPPTSYDPTLFARVLKSSDSSVLDSDNPDRANAAFAFDFSVGPGN